MKKAFGVIVKEIERSDQIQTYSEVEPNGFPDVLDSGYEKNPVKIMLRILS